MIPKATEVWLTLADHPVLEARLRTPMTEQRNVLRVRQSSARRSSFLRKALRYAQRDFIHGDARSRAVFPARVLMWLARRLAWTVRVRMRRGRRTNDLLDERVRIAVVTGGGLGDVLSTSRYVESLYAAAGRPVIDIFYPSKAYLEFLFARVPYVSGLFPASAVDGLRENYDAIVHVHRLVTYDLINHERLSRLCPELYWLWDSSERHTGEFFVHRNEMPQLDGDLAKRAVLKGLNRKSLLGHSGAVVIENNDWVFVSPSPTALRIFDRTGLKPGHYVTLHDGLDTLNHRLGKHRSTKQWPADYWQRLVDKLRSTHPGLKIVQVGAGHSRCYRGIDVDLIGNASFDEVAWLLKYAICHIDNESGLVRLAREVGGRSIVIFGPTDPDFFGFAENVNLRPKKCGNCFWLAPDWLTACPKGLVEPECTASIEPGQVLAALDKVLDERREFRPSVALAEFFQNSAHGSAAGVVSKNSGPLIGVSAQNLAREDSAQGALTTEVLVPRQNDFLAAAILDRVRGATARVAVVACQEDGEGVEDCLAKLDGLHLTWFRLESRTDSKNDKPAVRSLKVPEDKYGTELRYGCALNIPAGRSTFDFVIFASAALSDTLQLGFAIREMLRILKPEGALVWTFACQGGSSNEAVLSTDALTLEKLKGVLSDLGFIYEDGAVGQLQTGTQAGLVIELIDVTGPQTVVQELGKAGG